MLFSELANIFILTDSQATIKTTGLQPRIKISLGMSSIPNTTGQGQQLNPNVGIRE